MDATPSVDSLRNPEKVFVLSGPSGVGKNTVAAKVCQTGCVTRAVTATTRTPRPGEEDGIDYYFVREEQFNDWLENGSLLEYNEYGGNYYGTPAFSVNEATDNKKAVLLVIDVNGALKIKQQFPEVHLIFLKPPDIKTLEKRLRRRGDEDDESITFRLQQAEKEMNMIPEYDHVVVNDVLDHAVEKVTRILQHNV